MLRRLAFAGLPRIAASPQAAASLYDRRTDVRLIAAEGQVVNIAAGSVWSAVVQANTRQIIG